MDSLDKKDMAFETNLHQGSQQLQNKVQATEGAGSTRRYLYESMTISLRTLEWHSSDCHSSIFYTSDWKETIRGVLSQVSLKNGYGKPIPQGTCHNPTK